MSFGLDTHFSQVHSGKTNAAKATKKKGGRQWVKQNRNNFGIKKLFGAPLKREDASSRMKWNV